MLAATQVRDDRRPWYLPDLQETALDRTQAYRLLRAARHVYLWVPLRRGESTRLVKINKMIAREVIQREETLPEISFSDEHLYIGNFRRSQ